jgi:hypothetical protein
VTVGNIEQAIQQGLWRLDQSFAFKANRDFISSLTVGQIIKGKVLRHYEGGRYGVSFGGEERVVDSTIALRSGDIIHGRVVALDDKVHLQRVRIPGDDSAEQQAKSDPDGVFSRGREEDSVKALFQRHRATLTAEEHSRIRVLGRSAGNLSVVASSALVLRKLGLVLDQSLIRAVARALENRGRLARSVAADQATVLTADATEKVAENRETMRSLSSVLAHITVPDLLGADDTAAQRDATGDGQGADDSTAGGHEHGDRGARERQEWLLGRWLLNAQSNGAVAHRFVAIPIWLGDRLVELNLAFFSQTKDQPETEGIQYRRILLSLDLATLGHVDIEIVVANQRLSIAIEADSESATQLLASRLGDLKTDFSEFGWRLDELSYATRAASTLDLPSQAVVSHYVRQDSLSRLM